MSGRIVFRFAGLGQVGFWFLLSHAISLEGDAVGVVDDAIEDGVGGPDLPCGNRGSFWNLSFRK